jgi:hypothetical protein
LQPIDPAWQAYIETHPHYRRYVLGQLSGLVAVLVIGLALWRPSSYTPTEHFSEWVQNCVLCAGHRLVPAVANSQDWAALPGIGPVLAGRLVTFQSVHGKVMSKDALLRVSGIGPKTLDRFARFVAFESGLDNPAVGLIEHGQ